MYLDSGLGEIKGGKVIVSIPFKREGVSGQIRKPFSELKDDVSIPFKREGVSGRWHHSQYWNRKMFQFPSNGKVYLDADLDSHIGEIRAFQFPSNGKVYLDKFAEREAYFTGKVSIPFKREGVSGPKRYVMLNAGAVMSFNSLQNGKVYLDQLMHSGHTWLQSCFNSFKREGVSGHHYSKHSVDALKCFNSLQTGRCIWTRRHRNRRH